MNQVEHRSSRQRSGEIQSMLDSLGIEALLVTQNENRRYLSGFTGSAGHLIITAGEVELLIDGRYEEQAARQAGWTTLVPVGQELMKVTGQRLQALGLSKVGFEADAVTVGLLERLKKHAPAVTLVSTTGAVEKLRMAKDHDELRCIEAAADLADATMAHAMEVAEPGMTEAELSWRLERFMRENSAERVAFEIIVASGENSALPHHSPSQRPFNDGEAVLIDMGAVVGGYHSDITRTFWLGEPTSHITEYRRVWDLVDAARAASVQALRPGMTGVEADAIARDLIAAGGHADHFGHGLGHGVGLNIHEGPRLSPQAPKSTQLPVGTVVTVEPGIYLSGQFGVRIEDLIVLEETGARILSKAPKVRER